MKKLIMFTLIPCILYTCLLGDGSISNDDKLIDLRLAEEGDSKKQYLLSLVYLQGIDVPKDIKESVKWFKKATQQDKFLNTNTTQEILQSIRDIAEKGDAEAQYTLGMCYRYAAGVYTDAEWINYGRNGNVSYWPDIKKSDELFKKAGEQGHMQAQYELGMSYRNSSKYIEASKWLQQAAEQGHVRSQIQLATFYKHGMGIEKDAKIAIKWYTEALNQGDNFEQYSARVELNDLLQKLEQEGVDVINLQKEIMEENKVEILITNDTQTTQINNAENEMSINEPSTSSHQWWYVLAGCLILFGVSIIFLFKRKKYNHEKK